jgi:hypothetical protein
VKKSVVETGLSNEEFFAKYAKPGRVGLIRGLSWIDQAICKAQRTFDCRKNEGTWSHAFFIQGPREDGHYWTIESDINLKQKHFRLGAQENRLSRFCNHEQVDAIAILDFDLSKDQVQLLVKEGLELIARRAEYSLREVLGTFVTLGSSRLRSGKNLWVQDHSFYCSAFVRHLLKKVGVDLYPEMDVKNTTPQDIFETKVPHQKFVLRR